MNILYYLEPSVELGDPNFRFSTLKSILIPEIKGVLEADDEARVYLVLNERLFEKYETEITPLDLDRLSVISITDEYLVGCFGTNEDLPTKIKKKGEGVSGIASYAKYLSKAVAENIDITIAYETINKPLKVAFPEALHLNSMFGAFSRAPFPSMAVLDHEGIYDESYLAKNVDSIKQFVASCEYNPEPISELRRSANYSLSQNISIKEKIYDIKSRFENVVLFPLQVDGHLSVSSCTEYDDHFSFILDLLDGLPENTGLIVTDHNYSSGLTAHQFSVLRHRFPNFIHIDYAKDKVPSISQFIVPYVNGVVTISSSLAYQAALWQKPLLTGGRSHVSIVATAHTIQDFASQVSRKVQVDRDEVLSYICFNYNLFYREQVFRGDEYVSLLKKYLENHKAGKLDNFFFNLSSSESVLDRLKGADRGWLLRKEVSEAGLKVFPDYLRLGYSTNRAVSYDLFDTLVERDFVNPHELFLIVEIEVRKFLKNKNFNFTYFRREAEKDVRRPTKGEYEITIDQIYEQFSQLTGLSHEVCDKIKQLEISAELSLIHPKKFMIENYHFSKIMVDFVAIISDIYLEEDVIADVVNKVGASGYDLLYSSATTKTRKHNGSIYPQYLEILKSKGIPKNEALHVGDNSIADGSMAKMHGMNTYVKPKAIDNLKKSKIGQVMKGGIDSNALSTSVLIGMLANKFFSTSYNKIVKDSLFQGNRYQFGYSALGPLIYGFTQKLVRRVRQSNHTSVYFLSRDGWLLKEAFDLVARTLGMSIRTHYLYASRRATMVASIRNWEDIYETACQSFNAQPVSSYLYARFGLEWSEELEIICEENGYKGADIVSPYYEQKKLLRLLSACQTIILKNSEIERKSYCDYLCECGFTKECENSRPLVVDIGYSGSMQHYLKKILGIDKLDGFYLLTHHHARSLFEKDLFEGYLSDTDDHRTPYRHKLNDYVFLFESCLSSPEGSLLNFVGTGSSRRTNLLAAELEQDRLDLLIHVHRGARDFLEDICGRFGRFVHGIEFSPAISERIILNSFQYPNGIDAAMFQGVEVENVFGGGSVYLIASTDFNHSSDAEVQYFINTSKWKVGATALISYLSGDGGRTGKGTMAKPRRKVQIDKANRKRAKLKNNPYLYFADIKDVPSLRVLKHCFDSRYWYGRKMASVMRRMVR